MLELNGIVYVKYEEVGERIEEQDTEIERLNNVIKEVREYLPKLRQSSSYELDEKIDNLEEILDKVGMMKND